MADYPRLTVRLLDAHGVEVDGFTLPAAEAIERAGSFMLLHGTDPDEDGAASARGRIEFGPAKGEG